jgi:hypothetical protein
MKVREVVEASSHHISGKTKRIGRVRKISSQTNLRSHLTKNFMHSLKEKTQTNLSDLVSDRRLHAHSDRELVDVKI